MHPTRKQTSCSTAGTKGVDEVVKGIRVADKVGEVANVINKADNVIEGTSSTIPKVASTESKWLQQFASTGVSEVRAGKVFADEPISWTATRPKGTQQTYEVFQRNDINWDLNRTAGDKRFIGKTNAEAADAGIAPQLNDGNFATLHHLGQDSRGGLVEASTRYHGVGKYGQDILHSQYGKNVPHPEFPIDRQKFGIDTREYWKSRGTNR